MHAFLIQSTNREFIATKTQELLNSLQSIKLVYELETIDHVRDITKFTRLTAKQKSTIYIENIDLASIDAQNAFLKTLEEPQENISFILTARNIEKVVPTILSRVVIIEDETESDVDEKVIQLTQQFITASIGEQLNITSKIRKREEAIEFIKKLIIGGHRLMILDNKYAFLVEQAQNTFNALEKNGNVQIQLTHFVVQLHA